MNSLSKEKDFQIVFAGGKIIQDEYLIVRARTNGLGDSRWGLVVSAKVDRRAVARNRLRRQMREIIRKNSARLVSGLDVVVIAKKALVGKKFKEIENNLLALLKEIRVYD
ncbi:ribonuclease P protein component [Patescibacteria group bacterium]|nr:ribonuclease P protein component [Patescibacteria group bacterium]